MSNDEKYLPDQESYFLQSGKELLAFKQVGRKIMHVEIRKYYKRLLSKEELLFGTQRVSPQSLYPSCLA